MVNGVMFGVVVTIIGNSGGPKDVELLLVHVVLYPIESHIDCFGSDLFASGVGNDHGG